MNGSCAVPLGILHPPGVDLMAWTFSGFADQGTGDPCCFLVLAERDPGALSDLSTVSVRTHIGPRALPLAARSTPLACDAIAVIARAVLPVLAACGADRFRPLMPVLAPGLDAVLADLDACAGTLRPGGPAGALLADRTDFVPDSLIVRSPAGYACSRIAAVQFQAVPRDAMALRIATPLELRGADGAILIGTGRHVALRINGAA